MTLCGQASLKRRSQTVVVSGSALGRLTALVILFVSSLSVAHADVCSALRSQIRSGTGVQIAPLTRQLNAIGALQRQRRCSAFGSSLFSACRDLATRRADVQRQLQSASRSGGGNVGAILARLDDLGCSSVTRRARSANASPSDDSGSLGRSAMLFCVRPSDGYFFPAPHSQFTARQDLKTTQDMCRYICDDASVDVFTLSDVGLETEEMVSVATRKKYLDLPTAYAYRESAAFKVCDLQRYYRRVNEARARTVTPDNMANANIAVPTAKPDFSKISELTAGLTAYTQEEPVKPTPDRKVRQVGTAYFPAD